VHGLLAAGSGGFPGVATLLDVYSRRTGDPLDDLDWYAAFASFKFAVILEGIHYRHIAGLTFGDGFGEVSGLVRAAVGLGLQALARNGR
jgi:aminoglycoside phosphotransferase (APT) family kinase protein